MWTLLETWEMPHKKNKGVVEMCLYMGFFVMGLAKCVHSTLQGPVLHASTAQAEPTKIIHLIYDKIINLSKVCLNPPFAAPHTAATQRGLYYICGQCIAVAGSIFI